MAASSGISEAAKTAGSFAPAPTTARLLTRDPIHLLPAFVPGQYGTSAGRDSGFPQPGVSSSRDRLRPVLMTLLATVIRLLPIALKLGEGSESYARPRQRA